MNDKSPASETQEIMGREEIAARLRALADHSAPWKLSADPQVIWRVACRQAAAHFEALARLAPSATRDTIIKPEDVSDYAGMMVVCNPQIVKALRSPQGTIK